jgi:hypothetical protein
VACCTGLSQSYASAADGVWASLHNWYTAQVPLVGLRCLDVALDNTLSVAAALASHVAYCGLCIASDVPSAPVTSSKGPTPGVGCPSTARNHHHGASWLTMVCRWQGLLQGMHCRRVVHGLQVHVRHNPVGGLYACQSTHALLYTQALLFLLV